MLRDGVPVGQVTSAAWGETIGAAVGLGYLRDPAGSPVSREFYVTGVFEVNVAGRLVPASAGLKAPYDPAGSRVRPRSAGTVAG